MGPDAWGVPAVSPELQILLCLRMARMGSSGKGLQIETGLGPSTSVGQCVKVAPLAPPAQQRAVCDLW